jgi:hypothetical protein
MMKKEKNALKRRAKSMDTMSVMPAVIFSHLRKCRPTTKRMSLAKRALMAGTNSLADSFVKPATWWSYVRRVIRG